MAEPRGFSFDNWLTSPTFQMGASVLGAPNIGIGLTQGAQSSQAMALSRAKMQGLIDQQNQARRRQEAWNNIFPNGQPNTQHPLLKNVPPEIAALAATYGPDEGLSALQKYQFGLLSPDAALHRQQLELGNRQLQEQIAERQAMMPLKKQQLEIQVQQLKQNSEDPIDQMIRERVRANNAGAPAPVQPAQPNPNLRPQSAPMEPPTDPNFVQAQAPVVPPQSAPQPAARPQQDMVTLPGIGKVDVDTARAIQFNYARKGNQGAAKMIEEAIGSGLDKGARTELDKSRINLTNQYGRLGEIERQFDPAFQRVGTQLDMFFKAGSEKMFGSLPPEQKQQLERFHGYRSAAIGHFNQMLKELSGTAVSAQEFERIKAQLPNPGTGFANGIIDGDSPSVFQSKLKEAKRAVGLAMARSNFMAANGFRGDKDALAAAMPLDAMPNVIQRRTEQLQQQFLQQGTPPEQLREMVTKQLRQDFGIGI
jgi:hypothetical protein